MAIQIPLNAQLQNATQLQQQIQNAVNSVKLNLGGAGGSRALNSLSQPLGRLTGQADEFTKSLDAANARVLAFGASVGVLNVLTNAFKALVVSTIEVEKTLTDISVVFGKSSGEIKDFGKGIFTVAKQTGQSFQEVSRAALEFSRQGLTLEDTLSRTNDALILTRLTGLDTAKAVQGLTATINSFSKEALTSAEIVNKLASVDQKFAVSAADLTEALSRSASVAQNAGVNFDELIGIITSLQANTARGGAVIGNSIKTIFTRIQRPEVLKDLQDLGVAVKDVKTDKLLSASQILKNLAGNVKALGQIQKSDIFEEVAGGFQINQLQALLGDLAGAQSTAAKAQQIATGATNEAYVANERLNKTISALINSSVEGLKELGATLGDLGISDSIKNALGAVNGFIEAVQGLLEGEGLGAQLAQGLVKGIGSVLSGPGLALFGVIISKLVIDLGKFAVQGLKTFLGIGKAASEQKALQEAIVTTLSRNSALQAQINKFQGNAVAQASILAGLYNQQEASLKRQNAIAAGMTSVLFDQGLRAGPQGLNQTGRRRAAGGYLPSAEAADVSRGVGGASPSAQVVSIPNFAFGNGQRGTMVANTSEYIVPNYANGGSAIFNQDMVRSMGLPAGAQKIRAARGYIPNFAKERKRSDPKVEPYDNNVDSVVSSEGNTLVIDADKDIGGIGMLTIGLNENVKEANKKSYNFSIGDSKTMASDIPALKNTKWQNSLVAVKNLVGADGLAAFASGERDPEKVRLKFSNALSESLHTPLVGLANKIFGELLTSSDTPTFTEAGEQSFISPSVEGSIFQELLTIVSDHFRKKSQPAAEGKAFKGEDNRPFDFESSGPASDEFIKNFFEGRRIFKADAKRSDSSDSRRSFLRKIFNDDEVLARLKATRQDIFTQLPEQLAFYKGTKAYQTISKENLKADEFRASKGYIPNFANQALADSINREKIQSGLPMSAISVTQDNRLMNNRNPMGLAVINSRDEPNGKIPNFANPQPLTDVSFARQASLDLGNSLDDLNRKIKALSVEVSKGTKTEAEAQQALDQFVANLPNARSSTPGGKLGQSASLQNIKDVASAQLSDSIPQKVAKGFGDAAGKIFLLQSAVSFATGAFGDLDSATGRFVNKLAETSANLSSFVVAGQELASADLPGKFGGFIKTLGLAGLAVGGLYEGLKFADFAFKEISGENDKLATSISKLDTAVLSAAITLENFTPEGQKNIKDSGKKALEAFSGTFISSAKDNPKLQQTTGSIVAQGFSGEDIKKKLEERILQKKEGDVFAQTALNVLNASYFDRLTKSSEDIQEKALADAKKSVLQFTPESEISDILGEIATDRETKASGQGLATIREKVQKGLIAPTANAEEIAKQQFGPEATRAQIERTQQIFEAEKGIAEKKASSAKIDQDVALGEQISLDLAKQKVEALLEQKKAAIELSGSIATEGLRLDLETLGVSEKRKNYLEQQIELKKIDNKLSLDTVDIIQSTIDSLVAKDSDAILGVSIDKLNAISEELKGLDITNVDELNKALKNISEKFTLNPTQIANIKNLFEAQVQGAKDTADGQKRVVDQTKNFNDRLIDAKDKLQAARLLTEKIASDLERASKVRISFEEVEFGSLENQARILRERASATTNNAEQRRLNEQAIAIDKKLNERRATSSEKTFEEEKIKAESKRGDAYAELLRRRSDPINFGKTEVDEAAAAYATAEAALKILDNTQQKTRESFAATNQSLDLQAQAIYKLTSATESYLNTLLQFREGAGERIASADIGILSATDPNALASSTIQRQVEMEAQNKGFKNDKDYYKFVQKETPIRQKQFELAVETSAVRRNELENEIELMEEIAAISAATDEERLAKIKEIVDARNEEAQSFGAGFARGVGTLQDKTQRFRSEIGEQIPQLFSDNLAQGLNDAISGAKSLKDALRDAATSFFNAITKANIENIANRITSGGMGFFTGKANGGMISGGSGTKDDVPAMLMGGEYVVKKSAVKKYGSNFLDSLNQGKLSGYAAGGAVQSGKGGFYTPGEYGQGAITGQRQLLEFATQSRTSGQFDQMGSYGMSGASINLEAESSRLTMAGRENSPIFERTQQAKEEAFQVYLQSLQVDKQYKEQLKQAEEAEKARKKQLVTSIGMAVASSAISYGASAFGTGAENAIAEASSKAGGTPLKFWDRIGTGFSGGIKNLGAALPGGAKPTFQLNDFAQARRLKMPVSNFRAMQSSKGVQGYTPYLPSNTFSGGVLNIGGNSNNGGNELLPNADYVQKDLFDEIDKRYRANGGPIFGGSGMRDDVPAMLTGGEFVLNNRATQKLGMSNLQRLNSGDTSSQQSSSESSSDLTQALMSKLDELINETKKTSKDNIVVNVSGMDNKGEKNDGTQSANEKDLQKKIKAAVLEVITQEKRLGGSLNK